MDPDCVSVVMPVYQDCTFLDEAVQSAISQALPQGVSLELLVIDDGSTETLVHDHLTRLEGMRHPGLRVLRLAKNSGVSAARNAGISAARGRYLAFLDSDDLWRPGHISKHLAALRDHYATLCGSDYDGVDQQGHVHTPSHLRHHHRKGRALAAAFSSGQPAVYEHAAEMFIDCCPTHTAVITIDRAAYRDSEVRFADHLRQAEDVHLWIRLATQGRFVFLPESTAAYRFNPNSISRPTDVPSRDRWYVAVLHDLLQGELGQLHHAAPRRRLSDSLCDLSWAERQAGQFSRAWHDALDACRRQPTSLRAWHSAAGCQLALATRR